MCVSVQVCLVTEQEAGSVPGFGESGSGPKEKREVATPGTNESYLFPWVEWEWGI